MRILREMRADQLPEALAALDVVRELVEARARRRQHDGIAGLRELHRACHGDVERSRVLDDGGRPRERAADRRRIAADQQDRAAMRIDRRP